MNSKINKNLFKLSNQIFNKQIRFHSNKDSNKINEFKEKLKTDISPNSPIGIMDRLPKKEKNTQNVETVNLDPFAKFPNSTNPNTGEINGPTGPEPTRYGDWERKGRCTDF